MLRFHRFTNLLCSSSIKFFIKRNLSFFSKGNPFNSVIDVHPKIQDHILSGKPVVALESTIITHGMPYPHNLETALQVEDIVKEEGSTPATIAIIDGRIKIGLTKDQLERLANLSNDSENTADKVIKCSRRDLAYVLSKKICGGTTVAGTLIIANMVGIKIFATGGIGGVHREGHVTFDISADLIELGRTPIAVISSGIKSILDIPRTLEYLETQGVCVASYQSDSLNFPAFYTRSSGCKAPYNLDNPEEAALLIKSSLDLQLQSGILIGVPIPEENAISETLINDAINNALNKAQIKNIGGKNVTPFVLEAVSKITKGKSLNSNMALIKNNARVAAQIAVQLHNTLPSKIDNHSIFTEHYGSIQTKDEFVMSKNHLCENMENVDNISNKNKDAKNSNCGNNVPVVIGASIMDFSLTVKDDFKVSVYNMIINSKILYTIK